MSKTTRVPSQKCYACGYAFNASTKVEDDVSSPSVGDISVCIMCGALGIYNADMQVVMPNNSELKSMAEHPEEMEQVMQYQRAVRIMRKLKEAGISNSDLEKFKWIVTNPTRRR